MLCADITHVQHLWTLVGLCIRVVWTSHWGSPMTQLFLSPPSAYLSTTLIYELHIFHEF